MNTNLTVYASRDNEHRTVLIRNSAVVPMNTVTRARLSLQSNENSELFYHIDTDNPSDPIELINSNTVVRMRIGLIPEIDPGTYTGWLTISTADTPDGLAWVLEDTDTQKYTYTVNVLLWPASTS